MWGCSWFTDPVKQQQNTMQLRWELPYEFVGTGISSTPLVLGDSLVVMSAGKELWLVEQATGTVRWKTFVSNETNLQTDRFQTNGELLFATHVEDVRAYRLSDGGLAWLLPLPDERGYFYSRTMAYSMGRLNVAGARTIYSIDAMSGSIIWQRSMWNHPLIYGLTENNGVVYWGGAYRFIDSTTAEDIAIPQLGAIDLLSGDSIWTTTIRGHGGVIMQPVFANGKIFVGTAYEAPSAFTCLDASTGSIIWARETPEEFTHYESAVVQGGRVFTTLGIYGVQAFDEMDGTILWRVVPTQNFETRDLMFYEGYLYRTQGWVLYVFEPSSGSILHKMAGPQQQALVTIAAGNGRIFVQGHPSLMCFDAFKPGQ